MTKEQIIDEARSKVKEYEAMPFGWRSRAGKSPEKYLEALQAKDEEWFNGRTSDGSLLAIDEEIEAGYWDETNKIWDEAVKNKEAK